MKTTTTYLIACFIVLLLHMIRTLFPLLYHFWEITNMTSAICFIIAIFSSSIILCCITSQNIVRKLYFVLVFSIALLNIVNQFIPTNIYIIASIVILLLLAFSIVLKFQNSQQHLFTGLMLGLMADTTLRILFLTWDYTWQKTVYSLGTAILLSAVTVYFSFTNKFTIVKEDKNIAFFFSITSFIALQVLFLQNIAFVASSSETSIFIACVMIGIGNILGLYASMYIQSFSKWLLIPLATLAFFILYFLLSQQTIYNVILVVALQITAILLVFNAIHSAKVSPRTENYTIDKSFMYYAFSWLWFATLIFLYQVHYEMNILPVTNKVIPMIALLVLLLVFISKKTAKPTSAHTANSNYFVPFLVIAVPILLLFSRPESIERQENGNGTIRLLNYNVHESVNHKGILNPEAIAEVIEQQNPNIVVLQEVGRGWMISSTIDLVEWLSLRLRMPYVYAPAADGQFGNVIFSSLPITSSTIGILPQGNSSMARSYATVKIEYSPGEYCTIIGTHLQHRKKNTLVRIKQIEALLDIHKSIHSRLIITGDMNAIPGSPEINLFNAFISAQDATGNASLFTANSLAPTVRIDWIFGLQDTIFSDFSIPSTTASDHLPVVTTIQFSK